jgi:hypothetical protein
MNSCLDCLHCKVIYSLRILRCRGEGDHWHKEVVILSEEEVITGNIEHRKIFERAQRCKCYDPMPTWP